MHYYAGVFLAAEEVFCNPSCWTVFHVFHLSLVSLAALVAHRLMMNIRAATLKTSLSNAVSNYDSYSKIYVFCMNTDSPTLYTETHVGTCMNPVGGKKQVFL